MGQNVEGRPTRANRRRARCSRHFRGSSGNPGAMSKRPRASEPMTAPGAAKQTVASTLGIDAFNHMYYGINKGNWLNCVTGDSDKWAYIAPEVEPRTIDQASFKKTGQKRRIDERQIAQSKTELKQTNGKRCDPRPDARTSEEKEVLSMYGSSKEDLVNAYVDMFNSFDKNVTKEKRAQAVEILKGEVTKH